MPLFGDTVVRPDTDALFEALARDFGYAAHTAVNAREVFHCALSGGSTPEPFYMRLVTDPLFRGFPWERTHVWIVDERRVSETDPRNNFRMIRESLTDHVPMKQRNIHPMPVLTADPAGAYEQELRDFIPPGPGSSDPGSGDPGSSGPGSSDLPGVPRLDFVLLGMGDDAHTASLFPGSDAIAVTDRWVAVNDGPSVTPPPRVTMTYPLLNAARMVAVLVTGEKKAATIAKVRALREPDPVRYPITGIRPRGEMNWFLDEAASGS